jgi:lipopolysaccharide/colanic/teichoic acid biosynthesis glycosyltransferase
MHILLIHQVFAALGEPGGTRHHELARHLVGQGHRVTVLAGQVSYLTGEQVGGGSAPRQTTDDVGVTIIRCFTYRAWHRSFMRRVVSFLSFMVSSFLAGLRVRRVDLVWGTTPPLFQGLTAWSLARLKGAAFLFEVRDLWPAFAVAVGVLHNPLLIRLSEALERFLYRHADVVVINSPGFEQHVRARGARRVALVPNGVDVSMFNPTSTGEAFRRAHDLSGRFVALYAGAHGLSNDLGVVLEAADYLRDQANIIFAFVGDGKEKPALQARAKVMGLPNVRFVSALPKEEMPETLAAADAGIAILKPLDVYKTTYPNKVFDYMAAGRPVLLAIDGAIRDVVESAGAGVFVQPGDSKALAETVARLASEREACRRMGLAGRECVVESFDRASLAARMEKVMAEAVEERRSRPGLFPGGVPRSKRLLDLALGTTALVLLSPVLGALALAVRLRLGSPVLFRHVRPGYRGRLFTLLKLRSMTDGRDPGGNLLPDAERLTGLGRFLRAFSLDDLPNLVNVLRGEMSLVGPRPLLTQYLERYSPDERRRHDVLPGITGWAQVNGRNVLSWDDKFRLDLWYVDHWSFWLDVKILLLTVWRVLRREGISQPGHATAEEFQGQRHP